MKAITLYRHPDCERCRRAEQIYQVFDWFHRIEYTSATPGSGPLRLGEVAVYDRRREQWLRGIAAIRRAMSQVPLFWIAVPFTYMPGIRQRIDQQARGCEGEACNLPDNFGG